MKNSIRDSISSDFEGKAFERPLFYKYPLGLRYELSEGGSYINQVTIAHNRALEICRGIFSDETELIVILKFFGQESFISCLPKLRLLKNLRIYPNTKPEYWKEAYKNDDNYRVADDVVPTWHFLAFEIPRAQLVDYLWFPLVQDFGCFAPRLDAQVYFFGRTNKVIAFPYDDRGMDVISPNADALKVLYTRFNTYLLDYDREAMDSKFA